MADTAGKLQLEAEKRKERLKALREKQREAMDGPAEKRKNDDKLPK